MYTRDDIRATGRARNPVAPAAAGATGAGAEPVDTAKALNQAEIVWQASGDRVNRAQAALRIKADVLSKAVMAFQFGPKKTIVSTARPRGGACACPSHHRAPACLEPLAPMNK
jgi:hypothetical protein